MMEKSKEELIEEAMKLASSKNESDRNMAILNFKKLVANDGTEGKFQSVMFQIFKYFLEADLGVESEHDKLSDFLLNEVYYSNQNGRSFRFFGSARNMIDRPEFLNKIILSEPYFKYRIDQFLNKEMGIAWVKSLRYDALVSQLKKWEEEDKMDSERMTRIREIIGE